MAITWGTLRGEVARKLNDPNMQKYSDELLMDGVNDALRAFASMHTGIASDFPLTGDGTIYTYDLPPNIVDQETGVFAVQWKNQEWLREEKYWPASRWPSSERSTTSVPRVYILWPTGKISFSQIPGDGDTVTVHYIALYDEVTEAASLIGVPAWAREALKLYVAATTLEPSSTKAGQLGQYKSRREAGGPEDNPLLRLAEHYMTRYRNILADHPIPQHRLMHPVEDYRRS